MGSVRKYITSTFLILTLLASSCGSESEANAEYSATIKNGSVVGRTESLTSIYLSGAEGDSYRVEIIENEEEWCGFDRLYSSQSCSGTLYDGINTVFLYYKANTSIETRTATFKVTFGRGGEFELQITQLTENIFSYQYSELPAYVDDDDYIYTTYYTTTYAGVGARNFSVCYDTSTRLSLWVAYPLHESYTVGDGNRVDNWIFDPNISEDLQHNCTSKSYSSSTYDRGHQIPSASRDGTDAMNQQTFYMTNTTPQHYYLNRYLWATIETQVRSWMCADTLYVVTGPYFDPSQKRTYTTDNDGSNVPIPTHYFKALVRTRSGNLSKSVDDCTTDELKGICVWLPNDGNSGTKITSDMFKSIDEVEEIIGFDLFSGITQLDESSCEPSDWGDF